MVKPVIVDRMLLSGEQKLMTDVHKGSRQLKMCPNPQPSGCLVGSLKLGYSVT